MSAHPYQIYAPGLMDVQPGKAGTFQVVNTGTQPITVHDSLGRYSAPALRFPAADHATTGTMTGPWLAVWPHTFTLAPGQAETVHIKATVPHGAAGDHYLSVVWAMRPLHAQAGAVQASGAVASLVRVPLAGVATPVTNATAPPLAPRPHAAGHGDMTAVLTGAGIVLAVVVALIVIPILTGRWLRGRTAPEDSPYTEDNPYGFF